MIKKNNKYEILIPPLLKAIEDLDDIEAYEYFQWYQSKIYERIEYLLMTSSKDININLFDMIYESISLVYIWEWFLKKAKVIKKPKKERIDTYEQFNQNFSDDSSEYLSLQTEYIIRDIGMYLGEMFTKNFSQLYWDYYTEPKTDVHVNTPLLMGFYDKSFTPPFPMEFEPIYMVGVQAANLFDNTCKSEDLLNLYLHWSNLIL